MAREGIEPPTRGFSGRQRPILLGLSRSISDRPASTYDRPTEHRVSQRTVEYRGVQVLIRYESPRRASVRVRGCGNVTGADRLLCVAISPAIVEDDPRNSAAAAFVQQVLHEIEVPS
jgi:hypothetical protein